MKIYVLSKITILMLVMGIFIQITHAMEEAAIIECPCRKTDCKTISIPTGEKVREEINNHRELINTSSHSSYGNMHCAFVQNGILWIVWAANTIDPTIPVIFSHAHYKFKKEAEENVSPLRKIHKSLKVTYTIDHFQISVEAAIPDFNLCPNVLKLASGRNDLEHTSFYSSNTHMQGNFYPQDIILHCDHLRSLKEITAKSFALEVRKNMFNCQEGHMGILETVTDKEYLANFKEFYSGNYYGVGRKILELYFVLPIQDHPEEFVNEVYKYLH